MENIADAIIEGHNIVIRKLRKGLDERLGDLERTQRVIQALQKENWELKMNTKLAHRILTQEDERLKCQLFEQQNRRSWKC